MRTPTNAVTDFPERRVAHLAQRCLAHHVLAYITGRYDIVQGGPQPNVVRTLYDELVIALPWLTVAVPHMGNKCRAGRIEEARSFPRASAAGPLTDDRRIHAGNSLVSAAV